ncbi:MAG: YlbF family regulator [Lachnospiraceae bacterium]|nr:YlbF family regulator [Lachnospiraceae bacterium]
MSNEAFERALDELIEQLVNTEEYMNYKDTFARVKYDAGALESINAIRELNMSVQEMSEEEYERESENIALRMEELLSSTKVSDFIIAEVDFSKLYQYITDRIIQTLDDEDTEDI